jgi:hypothetical protein
MRGAMWRGTDIESRHPPASQSVAWPSPDLCIDSDQPGGRPPFPVSVHLTRWPQRSRRPLSSSLRVMLMFTDLMYRSPYFTPVVLHLYPRPISIPTQPNLAQPKPNQVASTALPLASFSPHTPLPSPPAILGLLRVPNHRAVLSVLPPPPPTPISPLPPGPHLHPFEVVRVHPPVRWSAGGLGQEERVVGVAGGVLLRLEQRVEVPKGRLHVPGWEGRRGRGGEGWSPGAGLAAVSKPTGGPATQPDRGLVDRGFRV